MPRYVPAPRSLWVADDVYDEPLRPETPIVDEGVGKPTGLLDARGHPLMRLPDPVGFGRRD